MKFDIESCKERLKRRHLHPGSESFYMSALEALRRDPEIFKSLGSAEKKVVRWYLLLKKPLTLEVCGQRLDVKGDRARVVLARAVDKLRRRGRPPDVS